MRGKTAGHRTFSTTMPKPALIFSGGSKLPIGASWGIQIVHAYMDAANIRKQT